MKRARTSGGSVTGGTGDIKPQWLTITTELSGGPNEYIVSQRALPVPRFGTMKTKATIMEILRVDWYLGTGDLGDTNNVKWGFLSTASVRVSGEPSSFSSLQNDAEDTQVFALGVTSKTLILSGAGIEYMPLSIDMTDNNGNGVLIATDKLFINGAGFTDSVPSKYSAKLLYRLVNVGITEYVGIVQSQQG